MGPNGPVHMVRYDYALTPLALKVPLAMKLKAPTGLSEEGHLPGRGNARPVGAAAYWCPVRATLEELSNRVAEPRLHVAGRLFVDAIWPQVVGRVNRLFDRHVHRVPNHLDDLLAVAFHCGPHERTRRHARGAVF